MDPGALLQVLSAHPCWTAELILTLHSACNIFEASSSVQLALLVNFMHAVHCTHMVHCIHARHCAPISSDWTCQDLAAYRTGRNLAAWVLATGVDTMSTADVLAPS